MLGSWILGVWVVEFFGFCGFGSLGVLDFCGFRVLCRGFLGFGFLGFWLVGGVGFFRVLGMLGRGFLGFCGVWS